MQEAKFPTTPIGRLKLFFTFFDSRWEDLTKENWLKTIYKDFSAGLIVAMTAIPMSMGFAMAMGMRPEHGIIAGALACIVGRTFGGSKYQVYGPTAAFIPVIAALISKYSDPANGGTFEQAHGFLVWTWVQIPPAPHDDPSDQRSTLRGAIVLLAIPMMLVAMN